MKKIVAATILLTLCLSGCGGVSNCLKDRQSSSVSMEEGNNSETIFEEDLAEYAKKRRSASFEQKKVAPYDTMQASEETIQKLTSLIGKNATELTEGEMELLLDTPMRTLHQVLGFSFPGQDDDSMLGWLVESEKMPGLTLDAGISNVDFDKTNDEPPVSLYILGKGSDNLPMGYQFDDVMNIWGETDITYFLYAQGFCGSDATPLERLIYFKGKLKYEFRVDYNNVFSPKEEHCLTVDLIQISKTMPFEFLQEYIDITDEIDQNGFYYTVNEGKRNRVYAEYFIISIGIKSEEKFTATSTYFIDSNFTEIIKANPAGDDIVVWKSGT